jgi:hypothetical protein
LESSWGSSEARQWGKVAVDGILRAEIEMVVSRARRDSRPTASECRSGETRYGICRIANCRFGNQEPLALWLGAEEYGITSHIKVRYSPSSLDERHMACCDNFLFRMTPLNNAVKYLVERIWSIPSTKVCIYCESRVRATKTCT